jgi:DNA-directed RNA polymerase subunit M/transcription elongation factor TFIIS
MNDRLKFDTGCPNNHNQTVSFSQMEFEAALQSDTLVFHCNTCDTDWPPSSEEIAKLREHFKRSSS